uniref:Uncharacterized protein n=1 Tax=Knipowitschia caucasica TaxID=637954 RepID=A0AAV2KM30_KNICA
MFAVLFDIFSLSRRTSLYSSSSLPPRPSVLPPPPPSPPATKSKSKSCSAPKLPKPYSAPAVPRLVPVSWLRTVHPGRILSRPPPSAYSTPSQRSSRSPPRPPPCSAPSPPCSAPPPPKRLQLTSLIDSWFAPLPCVRKVPRRTPTSKSAPPAKANSVPIVPQSEPTPAIPGPSSHRAVSETAQHKRKRSCEPDAKHPPKKPVRAGSFCGTGTCHS